MAPFGLFGGGPGATGKMFLNPDGPDSVALASKTVAAKLRRGDVFSMRTQGGGGYGKPEERDPAAIARDVEAGKVSPERARADYGWKAPAR